MKLKSFLKPELKKLQTIYTKYMNTKKKNKSKLVYKITKFHFEYKYKYQIIQNIHKKIKKYKQNQKKLDKYKQMLIEIKNCKQNQKKLDEYQSDLKRIKQKIQQYNKNCKQDQTKLDEYQSDLVQIKKEIKKYSKNCKQDQTKLEKYQSDLVQITKHSNAQTEFESKFINYINKEDIANYKNAITNNTSQLHSILIEDDNNNKKRITEKLCEYTKFQIQIYNTLQTIKQNKPAQYNKFKPCVAKLNTLLENNKILFEYKELSETSAIAYSTDLNNTNFTFIPAKEVYKANKQLLQEQLNEYYDLVEENFPNQDELILNSDDPS
ncbi:MAG: hypothetical protein AAFO15_02065 [Pseudomonadota bacterium]